MAKIGNAYREGVRGDALAKVIVEELLRLQDVYTRRANLRPQEENSRSHA